MKKMKLIIILMFATVTLFGAVDINTASVKELCSLKGIGSKKAETIVSFRKEHCFKTVDELRKVKGIGKKTVEKNRQNLKAGKCKK